MDEIDRAQIEIERTLERAIARAKAQRDEYEKYHPGECLNCGEEIQNARFCDPFCRHQFELRKKHAERNPNIAE